MSPGTMNHTESDNLIRFVFFLYFSERERESEREKERIKCAKN